MNSIDDINPEEVDPVVREKEGATTEQTQINGQGFPPMIQQEGVDFFLSPQMNINLAEMLNKETLEKQPFVFVTINSPTGEFGLYTGFKTQDFLSFCDMVLDVRDRLLKLEAEKVQVN